MVGLVNKQYLTTSYQHTYIHTLRQVPSKSKHIVKKAGNLCSHLFDYWRSHPSWCGYYT